MEMRAKIITDWKTYVPSALAEHDHFPLGNQCDVCLSASRSVKTNAILPHLTQKRRDQNIKDRCNYDQADWLDPKHGNACAPVCAAHRSNDPWLMDRCRVGNSVVLLEIDWGRLVMATVYENWIWRMSSLFTTHSINNLIVSYSRLIVF